MCPTKKITNLSFDEHFFGPQVSAFIQPVRMHFHRLNAADELIKQSWDISLQQDSVAVLLYHTSRKQIILVKQFRPAVFVQRIRTKPENRDKLLSGIEWAKYPKELGDTLELCAGLMDKKGKSPVETIRDEILEECGYTVELERIQLIQKYVISVGISSASEHLFYCEVDESMKLIKGGGLANEGEEIEKVFLDILEAVKMVADGHFSSGGISCPPSLFYAISWFLHRGHLSNNVANKSIPKKGQAKLVRRKIGAKKSSFKKATGAEKKSFSKKWTPPLAP
uniref:Uridine diphosphate glucose pyrophosphatase NUDT14 n=1 Tax=Ditylenchus dipsaci TaxID=166011 RepID=A0A915E6V2_9BILA